MAVETEGNRVLMTNIQQQVKGDNKVVVSALGGVILNCLNERNSLKMEVEANYYKQEENKVKKMVIKFEEKAHNQLTKVEAVAGGVYEGMKSAAKDIWDEADMALECGPFAATSYGQLLHAEELALQKNLTFGVLFDVPIAEGKHVRTLCFQASKYHVNMRVPLVMLHGLGGGTPTFHKNYRGLYEDREVYAIDLPGFALSSRIQFAGDAQDCTSMYIEMLDKWRRRMRLDQFILLGHSFGGYIASAYSIQYRSRVHHLVLVDPWGILPKKEDEMKKGSALWQKCAIELSSFTRSTPFGMLRSTGPLAPLVGDLFLNKAKAAYGDNTANYFFHAIIQESLATGEQAFAIMSGYEYLWAKYPLKSHLIELDDAIPITFIYGKESPFSSKIAQEIQKERRNVHLPDPIPHAGHHVHAQAPEKFAEILHTVFSSCDDGIDDS